MGLPRLTVSSQRQWRDWLAATTTVTGGVWVVIWKKDSGHPHVGYDDIVDEAVAASWVAANRGTRDAPG